MDDRGRTVLGLILATGRIGSRSDRESDGEPVALCTLDGVPLVAYAARTLCASAVVDTVLAGVPAGQAGPVRAALDAHVPGHRVVVEERDQHGLDPSVPTGVPTGAAPGALDEADVVVVHDCRRPLAPAALVDAVVAAVRADAEADLAVPVVAVTETVKELDGDGWIVRTLARDALRHAQSPWAFRGGLVTGWPPPTPARLAARMVAVAGHPDAFAVRTPDDLALAAAVLRGTPAATSAPSAGSAPSAN